MLVLTGLSTSTVLGVVIYKKWWCTLTQQAKTDIKSGFVQSLTFIASLPIIYIIATCEREVEIARHAENETKRLNSPAEVGKRRAREAAGLRYIPHNI